MSETKANVETPKKKRNVLVDLLLIMLAVAIVLAVVGFVQKENISKSLTEAQGKLEDALGDVQELTTKVEGMVPQADLDALATQLTTVQETADLVPGLQEQVTSLTAQVEGMVPQADHDALNEQLATMVPKADYDALAAQLTTAQETADQVPGLQEQIATLTTQAGDMVSKADYDALNALLTTAQTDLTTAQADLKTAQDTANLVPDLQAQVTALADKANVDIEAIVAEAKHAEHTGMQELVTDVQTAMSALKGDAMGKVLVNDLAPIKEKLQGILDGLQEKIAAFEGKAQ